MSGAHPRVIELDLDLLGVFCERLVEVGSPDTILVSERLTSQCENPERRRKDESP